MKKITFTLITLSTLLSCKHKQRFTTSPTALKPPISNITQVTKPANLVDSATIQKPPSNEQIAEWENEYPILNGKSKGIDYLLLNIKLKRKGNSLADVADALNDAYQSKEPPDKDDYDNKEIECRGSVNLKVQDFIGNSVPFVGSVIGNIQTLIVNHKAIALEDSADLFFRLKIDINLGYNRIPVIVINKRGKKLKSYIEFTYPME